jgi:amino acid transporter
MRPSTTPQTRHLSVFGATSVGVGAIVGGGILALAGVAFATTGPSAILAFALNGVIAILTAVSFAELASRFPESGGTYAYARKILTVEAAFAVGWVVWFASVVAAVLYALGFSVFLLPFLEQVVRAVGGTPPAWMGGRLALLIYALGAVAFYVWGLSRSAAGGGGWATIGKVFVFGVVIVGGLFVLVTTPPSVSELAGSFRPFFEAGGTGLLRAMGYTFIALQGFDLIAAVGGEVKEPEKNIPRAMFLSLGAALVIYLPLLFLVVALGSPGQSTAEAARQNPEILIAIAARSFLGPAGYWLVVVAGVLSMLSALQANLLAASRFARTMASDGTLPERFQAISATHGTPVPAIRLTGATVAFVLVAVPNVAAAGAMSGLIFLTSFSLAHLIAYLVRVRAGDESPFRAPAFPLIPVVGGSLCLALGLFQAIAVPQAGVLAALWLSVGAVLFVTQIGSRARVVDASSEARDPQLVRLRGRTPTVLVSIGNPASSGTLMTVAHAMAPTSVSRVLLLSVLRRPSAWATEGLPPELRDAQAVLGGAMSSALARGLSPETLITVHDDPWFEIGRVAAAHDCESVLLGIGSQGENLMHGPLEGLLHRLSGDVVILRAPTGWDLSTVQRILVPSGGRRFQSSVRARLLGSLRRMGERQVTFLHTLPAEVDQATRKRAERELQRLAQDEAPGHGEVLVTAGVDITSEVAKRAADSDLIILGLERRQRGKPAFGATALGIVAATECPVLMISQGV